jgi:hypothetical protein
MMMVLHLKMEKKIGKFNTKIIINGGLSKNQSLSKMVQ